jgi:hypothetical protein
MRPHAVLDVADAVHVEGIEADLFYHRSLPTLKMDQRIAQHFAITAFVSIGQGEQQSGPSQKTARAIV